MFAVVIAGRCKVRGASIAPSACHSAGRTKLIQPTTVESGLPGNPKYNTLRASAANSPKQTAYLAS